jgi:hypothetical protein
MNDDGSITVKTTSTVGATEPETKVDVIEETPETEKPENSEGDDRIDVTNGEESESDGEGEVEPENPAGDVAE